MLLLAHLTRGSRAWAALDEADSGTSAGEEIPALWIPDRVEGLEAPERLDEPDRPSRLGASVSRGSNGAGRVWFRSSALSLSGELESRRADAGAAWKAGAATVAGGALGTTGWGLAGEIARLTRPERGAFAPDPPSEPVRAAAGAGADVEGVALAWWLARPAGPMTRSFAARAIAGSRRRADGMAAAGEVETSLGGGSSVAARLLIARGDDDGAYRPVGGLRLLRVATSGRAESRIAAEAAGGDDRLDFGLDASYRARALRAGARWRRRGDASRSGALDLEAAWSESRAGVRLRWRAWSASGSARGGGDDGRAELDLRAGRGAPGSWRLRLGSEPRRPRGTGGERIVLGEIVAARERGRVLRMTAAYRAGQAGPGWTVGRMLGGSLLLERARRASLDLRIEAVRVERNAGVPGGSFEVAGGGSVRTRSRNGVRVAARGWVQRGAWRLGAALDDEETNVATNAGARAARARLWLTWNGDAGSR
jgi:hypothetical protein